MIRIKRITLQNFKGIKISTIDFNGANTDIFGANEAGKTTHQDAFTWCLFGKDSQGQANFEIKFTDPDGNVSHNLEHSVETVLDIDGKGLSLQRVYAEKWTKKRGQATTEFTGHITTYFINEVPAKKKEYEARIKEMIDESAFRLLTDPRFFNEQLHWQKRRELLLEVCGDVTDQTVIKSDKALVSLPDILEDRTIEDHKKMILSQRKGINDELTKIPTRIDEVKKSIVDIPEEEAQVKAAMTRLKDEKAKLESELADLQNGGEVSKLRIELQDVIAEINKAENAFDKDQRGRISAEQKKVDGLRINHDTKSKDIVAFDSDTARFQSEKLAFEKQVENLRTEWGQVDAEQFDNDGKCPTCGQDIPAEDLQKVEDEFKLNKANRLKSITETGQTKAARIKELEKTLTERETVRKDFAIARDKTLEDINAIEAVISSIRKEKANTEDLSKQAAGIEDKITAAQDGSKDAVAELTARITAKTEEIAEQNKTLLQFEANAKSETRIAELTTQEKKLVTEHGRLENELYLIEQFTRAKVNLLEEKVSGKFKVARFKLFNDQVNGGLTEICETVLNGVPYNSVNNAGQIQVGIDIIRTLQEHYGVSAPIWVDNRESVTNLPEINTQIISLIVSEKDKKLRVEEVA